MWFFFDLPTTKRPQRIQLRSLFFSQYNWTYLTFATLIAKSESQFRILQRAFCKRKETVTNGKRWNSYHLPRITASDSREELGVICVFLFLHTERTSLPFGHPLQSSKCTFLCCKIFMQNLVRSAFRVERHAAAYSATLLDVRLLSCISYKVNKTHFCTSTSFSFSYLTW